ncbi:MAG: 2-polyprenyl-3-methyl-6-methoxy-1,4-benzoquinone monooxygenase [Candidatus Competibacteraceae bacterium]|jgi:ubiquinone biosynthesis monooxygenase Coq7|nr:2-polyprenyl-3-methyl-6-methoxy-1,4-benzoquinone monooxygenase [Candidatus Competibacteraceae bacterium]
MMNRPYTPIDQALMHFDQALCTLFGRPPTTGRDNPADTATEDHLTASERQQSARLMRVNHTGEVCAQALYQGQAATAQQDQVKQQLLQAAAEENDHLDWCETRLRELNSHTSILNPLFYAGSFMIGALNGRIGDRWNLGFLAETEHQVVRHLDEHMQRLPKHDEKSQTILKTMKADEDRHATTALDAGGIPLPLPIRLLMRTAAKVMTRTTYWI